MRASCQATRGHSAGDSKHRHRPCRRKKLTGSLNIAFFGSSLLSAYWNGAATYYRGILRALHSLGHHCTFYEPDAFDRHKHKDIEEPEWAKVHVYSAEGLSGISRAMELARSADVLVKASGVGVRSEERRVGKECRSRWSA